MPATVEGHLGTRQMAHFFTQYSGTCWIFYYKPARKYMCACMSAYSPSWPWTWKFPASSSPVLELQAHYVFIMKLEAHLGTTQEVNSKHNFNVISFIHTFLPSLLHLETAFRAFPVKRESTIWSDPFHFKHSLRFLMLQPSHLLLPFSVC